MKAGWGVRRQGAALGDQSQGLSKETISSPELIGEKKQDMTPAGKVLQAEGVAGANICPV